MRGAFTVSAVNVLTTATLVVPRSVARGSAFISNKGPNAIYIGPDNAVTTATGFPVPAGDSIGLDDSHGDIYAIAETANQSSPANTRALIS